MMSGIKGKTSTIVGVFCWKRVCEQFLKIILTNVLNLGRIYVYINNIL